MRVSEEIKKSLLLILFCLSITFLNAYGRTEIKRTTNPNLNVSKGFRSSSWTSMNTIRQKPNICRDISFMQKSDVSDFLGLQLFGVFESETSTIVDCNFTDQNLLAFNKLFRRIEIIEILYQSQFPRLETKDKYSLEKTLGLRKLYGNLKHSVIRSSTNRIFTKKSSQLFARVLELDSQHLNIGELEESAATRSIKNNDQNIKGWQNISDAYQSCSFIRKQKIPKGKDRIALFISAFTYQHYENELMGKFGTVLYKCRPVARFFLQNFL